MEHLNKKGFYSQAKAEPSHLILIVMPENTMYLYKKLWGSLSAQSGQTQPLTVCTVTCQC